MQADRKRGRQPPELAAQGKADRERPRPPLQQPDRDRDQQQEQQELRIGESHRVLEG